MYKVVLLSWEYPILTLFISIAISAIMAGCTYAVAILTQKIRGYDEEKEKWNFEKPEDYELKLYERVNCDV